MNHVSRFEDLDPDRPRVAVRFDGRELMLPEGANLAAALLAAGIEVFRQTPHRGVGRAPYCMMGVCFDCLVEIGGVTRQACLLEVAAGLDIRPARQLREGPYAAR